MVENIQYNADNSAIDNALFGGTLIADTISEKTSGSGVTVDGLLIKDGLLPTTYISSGNYSPTVGDEVNIASHGTVYASWIRIGNVVFVTGFLDITASGAGEVDFSLTLPVASTLTGNDIYGNICGVYTRNGTLGGYGAGYRSGNTVFFVMGIPNTNANKYGFTFMYQIK